MGSTHMLDICPFLGILVEILWSGSHFMKTEKKKKKISHFLGRKNPLNVGSIVAIPFKIHMPL